MSRQETPHLLRTAPGWHAVCVQHAASPAPNKVHPGGRTPPPPLIIPAQVRLLEPGSWDALWRHALLPGERALVIRTVRLREARTGATVPFLAVGAGFLAGEDYPCGGRVLLCEIRRGAGGRWQSRMAYAR